MIEKLALPEIRELLDAGDLATLGGVLNGWLPADLAGVLERPGRRRAGRGSSAALKRRSPSQAFEYLDLDDAERLLDVSPEAESAAILNEMAPDDRTALLEELPPRARRAAHRAALARAAGRGRSRCWATARTASAG